MPVSGDPLRYDDVRGGPIVLTEEEDRIFRQEAARLKSILTDPKVIARYKLEILFGKVRTNTGLTPGVITFWANGTKFHGGGDEKLYLCPGRRKGRSDCEALLKAEYNSAVGICCPACGTMWPNEEVIGEIFLNLPMRKWAEVLYNYFRLCEYHCDLYLKHAPRDVRSVSLAQVEKQTWAGSQKLEKARETRARVIYPLRNIIKDTSAGADLLRRFYDFITA